MDRVTVTCTNTGVSAQADVLRQSDKSIRVALVGTNLVINMSRADTRRPYVGHQGGLEFTTNGV